jgi:hypothetical protein
MFCKGKIQAGSPILYEKALIAVKGENSRLAEEILKKKDQSAFLALAGSPLSTKDRLEMLLNPKKVISCSMDYKNVSKICSSNCFALGNSRVGLFNYASFFNHDCFANVDTIREISSICMVAKKNLEEGEMLCINYLGSTVLKDHISRRNDLESWGFACQCPRCISEADFLNYDESDLLSFSIAYRALNVPSIPLNIEENEILRTNQKWKYLVGIHLTEKALSETRHDAECSNCDYYSNFSLVDSFDSEPSEIQQYRNTFVKNQRKQNKLRYLKR